MTFLLGFRSSFDGFSYCLSLWLWTEGGVFMPNLSQTSASAEPQQSSEQNCTVRSSMVPGFQQLGKHPLCAFMGVSLAELPH